jgi:hypothetical protein
MDSANIQRGLNPPLNEVSFNLNADCLSINKLILKGVCAVKRGDWRVLKTGYVAACLAVAVLLTAFWPLAPAGAHSGTPEEEVDLPALLFYEGDRVVKVSFKDVQDYYRSETHKREEFDLAFSYRAFQVAKKEIWGDEVPRREDIQVFSPLPSPSSVLALRFITGGEEPAGDGFQLVLPGGAPVQDLSYPNLYQLAGPVTVENYAITFTRRSTGESVTIKVKDGVLTEEYFRLRSMAHSGNPGQTTPEELDRYIALQNSMKNFFIDTPAWELFEGVKKPFPFRQVIIAAIGMVFLYGAVGHWRETAGKKSPRAP